MGMEISGKTAIVTGAASGIGLSIATALAEAGATAWRRAASIPSGSASG
jgi:NAD(P)-dependent dehydrogenase (short-subunit alcohol dehydrogenase family)